MWAARQWARSKEGLQTDGSSAILDAISIGGGGEDDAAGIGDFDVVLGLVTPDEIASDEAWLMFGRWGPGSRSARTPGTGPALGFAASAGTEEADPSGTRHCVVGPLATGAPVGGDGAAGVIGAAGFLFGALTASPLDHPAPALSHALISRGVQTSPAQQAGLHPDRLPRGAASPSAG